MASLFIHLQFINQIKEALGEAGLEQMKADLKIQAAVELIKGNAKEV